MIFHPTPLAGACTIELERKGDDRGFFARFFCAEEFQAAGLASRFVQVNNSLSVNKGTLRGLHYQLPPAAETKIVRCIRGSLFDVIIDLREGSPSFGRWFGAELNADNRLMMYVPKGFAHAILTLEDNTEALYLVDQAYSPGHERGVRWNDPYFAIEWPIEPREISEKDSKWRDFDPDYHGTALMRSLA